MVIEPAPKIVQQEKIVGTYQDVPLTKTVVTPLPIVTKVKDDTYRDVYHSPRNYFTSRDNIQRRIVVKESQLGLDHCRNDPILRAEIAELKALLAAKDRELGYLKTHTCSSQDHHLDLIDQKNRKIRELQDENMLLRSSSQNNSIARNSFTRSYLNKEVVHTAIP